MINERQAIKSLSDNSQISIVMADKARQLVILDTQEYLKLMDNAIQSLKVRCVNKDPTNTLILKLAKLRKLKPLIPQLNYDLPPGPTTPLLFGTVKTHKTPMAIRPMVAKYNSPGVNLEKSMYNYLKPFFSNHPYTTHSSTHIKNLLFAETFDESSKFYSMDVTSLFPSIPLPEVKDLIIQKLQNEPSITSEQITHLADCLDFIFNSQYFKFNQKIYQQLQGTPMGSSLSGLLADIFMQHLENNLIPGTTHLSFYKRYVDDVILVWSGNTLTLEQFISKFNNFHPNLSFTYESPLSRCLNFLDLTVMLDSQNKLYTRVYHKPCANESFIPFTAYAPYRFKAAAFRSSFLRAYDLSSTRYFRNSEVKRIFDTGYRHGYGFAFLHKIHMQAIASYNLRCRPQLTTDGEMQETKFCPTAMPYVQGLSAQIGRQFKKVNRTLPIANRPNLKRLLVRDRDRLEDALKPGIYTVPIKNPDNTATQYIGLSRRRLETRLTEHKRDVRDHISRTGLSEYVLRNHATPLWDQARILAKYASHNQAIISEAIHIANSHNCNRDSGITINPVWSAVMNRSYGTVPSHPSDN